MSYDIRLKDPVTDETLDLPLKHVMTGGTYQADYDEQTRTFSPKPISEAWLNVTYNYGRIITMPQMEIHVSLTMKSLLIMPMGQRVRLKQSMASAVFTARQGRIVFRCCRI